MTGDTSLPAMPYPAHFNEQFSRSTAMKIRQGRCGPQGESGPPVEPAYAVSYWYELP